MPADTPLFEEIAAARAVSHRAWLLYLSRADEKAGILSSVVSLNPRPAAMKAALG